MWQAARTRGVELGQRGVQLTAQVSIHGHKRGLLHRVLKHLVDRALQPWLVGRAEGGEVRSRVLPQSQAECISSHNVRPLLISIQAAKHPATGSHNPLPSCTRLQHVVRVDQRDQLAQQPLKLLGRQLVQDALDLQGTRLEGRQAGVSGTATPQAHIVALPLLTQLMAASARLAT